MATAALVEKASALVAAHPRPVPPIDLEPYLLALAVKDIRERGEVGPEGALLARDEGFDIAVPAGLSLGERRWVVAQQLAAILASSFARPVDLGPAALELLLPSGVFGPAALDAGPTVESMPALAARFLAPLRPVAERFCELVAFRCLAAFWHPLPTGELVLNWQVASPELQARFSVRAKVSPLDPPFASYGTGRLSYGRGRLSLGGPLLDYYIESVKVDEGVLSLAILERHAPLLAAAARRGLGPARH
ncbi:MAG TPA: hypothetical protein DCM14_01760 [Clostridiales bacterium UBA8153]|nr:hypothetical protein [Clostridiales bacterium UBA8153]